MTQTEQTNAQMRGALILAGLRIQQLTSGDREDPVLAVLERVLRRADRAGRERKPKTQELAGAK